MSFMVVYHQLFIVANVYIGSAVYVLEGALRALNG